MRRSTAATAVLALALALSLGTSAAEDISYIPFSKPATWTNATNQKNLTTYAVSSTFSDEFQSVQSCLPVAIGFVTANNASVTSYKFKVNSTSLEQSYNLHPFVKAGVLTLALNGTIQTNDLVNVTITVPDNLAAQISNVTITGQSYMSFAFNNVTTTKTFQAQIAATGVLALVHNPQNLLVYTSTNGSAQLDGKLNNVYINAAASQPVILTNAQSLTLAKTGKGSVFIGNVTNVAQVSQTGSGAISANQTNYLNLIQQGPGSVLMNVIREANITYAGGKNTTRINGLGTVADGPAIVNYYNSGNGTLIFTGKLEANGVPPPAGSCLNITGFSSKPCVDSVVLAIPQNPQFPIKRPRCKGGDFILRDSEQCYASPLDGYQCQTVPPVNGGYKFLLIISIIGIAALLIWVNGL